MADFAGARAAIRSRITAGWSTTPVAYENEPPAAPWPPVNDDLELVPWTYVEIAGTGSELAGASGLKGQRLWRDYGLIHAHVFVPIGSGTDLAYQHATAIAELFRAAEFYQGPDGQAIRTLAPMVDGGEKADDYGAWFRASMTVEFDFYRRG